MTREPYSTLLGQGSGTGPNTTTTLFTVPAGRRYVVMSIALDNGAVLADIRCRFLLPSTGINAFYRFLVPRGEGIALTDLRWTFLEGWLLNLRVEDAVGGGNTVRGCVWGYDLEDPP